MINEELMVAIDRLIETRIDLESEKKREPSYPLQIKNAEWRVRIAQIKLIMLLDTLEFK